MATKTEEKTATDKLTAARNKNLDLAIQQIAKDYGEGAIMRLGDEKIVDIDVIPTGNILIDRALGVGGFPRGRVVEVFGPESSGKTTLTLHKPSPGKNWGDVWKAGDNARRKGLKVLRQYARRYPAHRCNQTDRRRCHWQPHAHKSREEQSRAAIYRSGIRHHVQRGNL